jgi:hypothetical protein
MRIRLVAQAERGGKELTLFEDNMNNTPKTKKLQNKKIRVNGRIVGVVVGNEFRKTIHTNWILRTPPALANDIQALHDAESLGAVYCVFTNADTGIIYRVSIAKIWDMGFAVNRGFGEQIALSLSLWLQERDSNYENHTDTPAYTEDGTTDIKPIAYKSHAITGTQFTEGKPKQMELFGGMK